MKRNKKHLESVLAPAVIAFALFLSLNSATSAQTVWTAAKTDSPGASLYLDLQNGLTADEAVALGLENNGEIQALRKEVEAARALVKQAGLRANPKIETGGTREIGGMGDSQLMVEGMLPLELGGRRAARIRVAQAELAIRELALANQERLLAGEIRSKFGETLAKIEKLELLERILSNTRQGYEIISAKVTEGRTPPLEQNQLIVEVNRLQSMRETSEGGAEAAVFELKNMIGMKPEDPLRLRGSFENLVGADVPALDAAIEQALRTRPDLLGARAMESLALARLEQARAEGKIDASVKVGYQRMKSGFPLSGIDEMGNLSPIENRMNFLTFGVEIDLPVLNRNQGMIEAAKFEQQAAQRRIEFGELTIRREVSAAFARYSRAVRALSIFQNGVRNQANANLRVVWQTYELGRRTLSDYIAEERRFLDVENELVDARLETYQTRIEILRAANAPELIKK
jgi:outer membrane protein, heavy metal efflux system